MKKIRINMDKIYKQLISSIVTFKELTYSANGTLLKDKREWRSRFWFEFLSNNKNLNSILQVVTRNYRYVKLDFRQCNTYSFVLDEILSVMIFHSFDV